MGRQCGGAPLASIGRQRWHSIRADIEGQHLAPAFHLTLKQGGEKLSSCCLGL